MAKTKAAKPAAEAQATTPEAAPIVTYKGFDSNLKCRDFQYEFGKEYENAGGAEASSHGFHACEYPLDVFNYYPPAGSRFAQVEQSGVISRHDGDNKVASSKIEVTAEIGLPGIIKAAVEWTMSRAKQEDTEHATGYQGAASSTGYRGAASSTGNRGAASSTGDYGAASSTGDYGAASSTGYQGAASSTGDYGAASSTGDYGAASSTGRDSAAMASGYEGKAKGAIGCALFLVHRDNDYKITKAGAAIVGENGIKPDVWYSLDATGAFVEV